MRALTRRSLIRRSTAAIGGSIIASPLYGLERVAEVEANVAQDEDRKQKLIKIAVDSAMAAGAAYADARLSFTREVSGILPDQGFLGFGVRALFDGYWGFSASPVWNEIEARRLGKAALENAKVNVLGKPREIRMASNNSAASGNWVMPVKWDPFEIPRKENEDILNGLMDYMNRGRKRRTSGIAKFHFKRQFKDYGSSDGQYIGQKVYLTGFAATLQIQFENIVMLDSVEQLSYAGMGHEYLRDQPVYDYVDALWDDMEERSKLPIVPVDVGKFTILMNARGVADCIRACIGEATEIDRAMGFEANAGGTSYIVDPDEAVGTMKLGSPAWNIIASRSIPGGCSTVKWDDEGVAPPIQFDLVRNGILVDMQTSREGQVWIRDYYKQNLKPEVSNGCMWSYDAVDSPLVRSADLTVQPDPSASYTLNELRKGIDKGIEWHNMNVSFDFQLATAMVTGEAFEIRDGKRVARIANAGMLFRASELLKNLVQLGSAASVMGFGSNTRKGQPAQVSFNSVFAPPAVFKEMTIIDIMRKA